MQGRAVLGYVVLEGAGDLLDGGAVVPFGGDEEVGEDGLEVDGEDERDEGADAVGGEVDVAVAEGVEFRGGDAGGEALADEGGEGEAEAGEV